ncbi:hypothetical protein GWK47_034158 [Chionoecetes opilio]|uniref:Uncharacterized protein n=1 Tax=Chionoecetes opilio TaxID=41210 RepID=A0A8J4YHS7_CHIOP|nr:hypothetical protein GWK47_034158 [Chionoecetes opilio]
MAALARLQSLRPPLLEVSIGLAGKAGHPPLREDEPQPSTAYRAIGGTKEVQQKARGVRGTELVASGPKGHRAALGLAIDPLEKKGQGNHQHPVSALGRVRAGVGYGRSCFHVADQEPPTPVPALGRVRAGVGRGWVNDETVQVSGQGRPGGEARPRGKSSGSLPSPGEREDEGRRRRESERNTEKPFDMYPPHAGPSAETRGEKTDSIYPAVWGPTSYCVAVISYETSVLAR